MKKLICLLLIMAGCTPYQRLEEPVSMRYSVGVYYLENFEGNILCRDLVFKGDTVMLKQAGYYPRALKQRYVADIQFIGDRDFMVIDMGTRTGRILNGNPESGSAQEVLTFHGKSTDR